MLIKAVLGFASAFFYFAIAAIIILIATETYSKILGFFILYSIFYFVFSIFKGFYNFYSNMYDFFDRHK